MCGDPAPDGTAGAGRMVGWTIGRLLTTIDRQWVGVTLNPRLSERIHAQERQSYRRHGE
jgi:hypothetical protein